MSATSLLQASFYMRCLMPPLLFTLSHSQPSCVGSLSLLAIFLTGILCVHCLHMYIGTLQHVAACLWLFALVPSIHLAPAASSTATGTLHLVCAILFADTVPSNHLACEAIAFHSPCFWVLCGFWTNNHKTSSQCSSMHTFTRIQSTNHYTVAGLTGAYETFVLINTQPKDLTNQTACQLTATPLNV